ncbi:MAG: ATP-binding cassette domain-containing protein [Candidatus Hodarchaeota archaeon]
MVDSKSRKSILQVEGLTKWYGSNYNIGSKKVGRGIVKAVQDVSFSVREEEIFGFLGPNGAGKTTTMRSIMNYLNIQSGSIKIFGLDYKKDALMIRKRIGYLPDGAALYDNFTGLELIDYFGNFRSLDNSMLTRLRSLFKVNLNQKIGSLSSGNRQQAALIAVMASNPDLLILDEPSNGLDPLMAARLHQLLIELRGEGKTIFLSSHDLSEVQKVCDRVGIIKEGHMIVIEDVEGLLEKSLQTMHIEFVDPNHVPSEDDLRAVPSVESVQKNNQNSKFYLKIREDVNDLLKFLSTYQVKRMTLTDASLEEVFLHYYTDEE